MTKPKGYTYIIFDSDKQVKALLAACTIPDNSSAKAGKFLYNISTKRIKTKDVNVMY